MTFVQACAAWNTASTSCSTGCSNRAVSSLSASCTSACCPKDKPSTTKATSGREAARPGIYMLREPSATDRWLPATDVNSRTHDRSGLFCRFEDVRLHPEFTRRFHVVGTVVEEKRASRFAAERIEAMAIDGRIGLGSAELARPDLDLEFVEPVELAPNIGKQVMRHVGEDGGPH